MNAMEIVNLIFKNGRRTWEDNFTKEVNINTIFKHILSYFIFVDTYRNKAHVPPEGYDDRTPLYCSLLVKDPTGISSSIELGEVVNFQTSLKDNRLRVIAVLVQKVFPEFMQSPKVFSYGVLKIITESYSNPSAHLYYMTGEVSFTDLDDQLYVHFKEEVDVFTKALKQGSPDRELVFRKQFEQLRKLNYRDLFMAFADVERLNNYYKSKTEKADFQALVKLIVLVREVNVS